MGKIGIDMVWQENKVKFLGKTIDNYSICDSHVLDICSKTNKKLSVLYKLNISEGKDTI